MDVLIPVTLTLGLSVAVLTHPRIALMLLWRIGRHGGDIDLRSVSFQTRDGHPGVGRAMGRWSWMPMARREFVHVVDAKRVVEAIASAERRTSADIRVCIAPLFWGSVSRNARRAYDGLGMRQAQGHSGVLFFLVPSRGRFVVLGHEGVRARNGQPFWNRLRDTVREAFQARQYTEGLIRAIDLASDRLPP